MNVDHCYHDIASACADDGGQQGKIIVVARF